MSLRFRIVLIGLLTALACGGGAMLIGEMQLRRLVDSNQDSAYYERLHTIHSQLAALDERLNKTGMQRAYAAEFHRLALTRLQHSFAQTTDHAANRPIIIDASDQVVLGSDRPESQFLANDTEVQQLRAQGFDGQRWLVINGRQTWLRCHYFEPWDWHIAYLVPQSVYYADVYQFRLRFGGLMLILVLVAIAVMAWLIRRSLKPINGLITAATAMAEGDLEHRLPDARRDELGILTKAFADMRQAVTSQMAKQLKEIDERMAAEQALRESETQLATTLDSIGDAVIATDARGQIQRINPTASTLCEHPVDTAVGQHLRDVFCLETDDDNQPAIDWLEAVLQEGRSFILPDHGQLVTPSGKRIPVTNSVAPIRQVDGSISGCVLVFRDISAQAELEEQLRQSQKMDAVGQLAGGIAHDFNNMLGAIQGAGDLLGAKHQEDQRSRHLIDLIITACERAADLTAKLLAFSRKGKVESTPVDMHQLIRQTCDMLSRTIDKRIIIELELDADPATAAGDPSLLQNALLNLGINARDAMPEGGVLTFGCQRLRLGPDDYPQLSPGHYLSVSVSDTGSGIPQDIQERIFEPFFTTKEAGKGTGLGLAAVYGTVREHEGHINLTSVESHGTTFTLLLPCSSDHSKKDSSGHFLSATIKGRVLLVDDEELFRSVTRHLLEDAGMEVVEAADGEAGLAAYRDEGERLDLVIVDMVMPRLDGAALFKRIRAINPEAKVILMSGFLGDARVDELRSQGLFDFLPKPTARKDLVVALGRALSP
ncbi:MAG: response regulator [Planctomycetota bacterium]|jgi:PAS domain S-box-containing protein|nr:response regulator [Planctomycetota bacterium]